MNTPMTPEDAKQIIADKIPSLEWHVSNIRLGTTKSFDVSSPPLLRGSVGIYSDNDGHVCLQSECSIVFESSEGNIIAFFKRLLESHLSHQDNLRNEAVIKTAIALQSL